MNDTDDARSAIQGYHAHIYYGPSGTRERAARIRERIAGRFPAAKLGRWHDVPVGPHPRAMYQVAFSSDLFAEFVPWLMLNRDGLAVLVHPETGRPRDDHLIHALWLGEMLPLDASVLPETEEAVG